MTTAGSAAILLVDDLNDNLVALEALVRGEGREVFCASSGDEALSMLLEHEFAVAILDVQMPGMNGFELAQLMRGTERTRRIPIVFVTAAGQDSAYSFHGYETGAVDFLYKPLDPQAVRSKVNVFVDLFRQRLALEQAQQQLKRAVTMRDDFMSMVSHELRTPLNTLFLQAQMRKKIVTGEVRQSDLPTLRKMVERDERQIRSMVRLIDDMLDVSRLRSGTLGMSYAPADLAAITRGVVDSMVEPALVAGCMLTLEAPDTLPLVCDEFRVEQVVTNLLTNALRYGAGHPVTVRVEAQGENALVVVRDGGIGIAEVDQDRIFGQFERTDDARKVAGLGLGLFITRHIARAHGGEVSVLSEPGQGAQFTVRLPLRPA